MLFFVARIAGKIKKKKIFLFYCKATTEAANSPQGEMMPQRFKQFLFLLRGLFRVGLWGVGSFSTLWKQYLKLPLSGDFQMPFHGLHGGFSETAQSAVVPFGSLHLSECIGDRGHVHKGNQDSTPRQTNNQLGQAADERVPTTELHHLDCL